MTMEGTGASSVERHIERNKMDIWIFGGAGFVCGFLVALYIFGNKTAYWKSKVLKLEDDLLQYRIENLR